MSNRNELVTSITVPVVNRIMQDRSLIVRAMRDSVNYHYNDIRAELDIIAGLDSDVRAQHAIVFSILSPQCPFAKNVKATTLVLNAMLNGGTESDYLTILQACGIGLQNAKSHNLALAADYIRSLSGATLNRALLCLVRGVSLKASAMTLALYDEHSPVYTLDTHMLRGIMRVCGLHVEGTYTITDAAYRKLEAFLVEIAITECADASIFLTQWAMWNDFGFKGKHQVHTPIFGL